MFRSFILILSILRQNLQCTVNAYPQLDIPFSNLTHTPIVENRFQTNGHSEKSGKSVVSKDQTNEIGISDTLNFDRDRSQRYGPPYSDENDNSFYSYNNNNNNNNRYYNQNFDKRGDDDDKYYIQPRPFPDLYYVSEKERTLHVHQDYYSKVCKNTIVT